MGRSWRKEIKSWLGSSNQRTVEAVESAPDAPVSVPKAAESRRATPTIPTVPQSPGRSDIGDPRDGISTEYQGPILAGSKAHTARTNALHDLGNIGQSSRGLQAGINPNSNPIDDFLATCRQDNIELMTLDPEWINIDVVCKWIQHCISEHGPQCWPSDIHSGYPEWLIDVELRCLVPAQREHRYFALSYVWGQVESASAVMSNIKGLQEAGVFSLFSTEILLPKTILHAIVLVELLGERYLWVDRLCICQDDEASKQKQISVMGDIYANAFVTIIAGSGWDANHGFRGIKGLTEPRSIAPNIGDDYFKSVQPQSSPWFSRGWTFQELFFSRRKLMFQYNAIFWECDCDSWFETTGCQHLSDIPRTMRITPSNFRALQSPSSLNNYFELVNEYNTRKLTFPEDALRGFTGVISTLSRDQFSGGFLWGLPVDCMDAALLWAGRDPLQRRRPSGGSFELLPSWSWVGWEGKIEDRMWTNIPPNMPQEKFIPTYQQAIELLAPNCSWSYSEDASPAEIEGRVTRSNTDIARPSSYLNLTCMVARFRVYFTTFQDGLQSRLSSRHIGLCQQSDVPPGFEGGYRPQVTALCGYITPDDPARFSYLEREDNPTVELVCMSRSQGMMFPPPEVGDDIEQGSKRFDYMREVREYFNVLCISWLGDIAYREGVGRVAVDDWTNAAGTERRGITLG